MELLIKKNGASSEIIRDKYALDEEGISKWLKSKNIISASERLLRFQDNLTWERAGAETYWTSFLLETSKQNKHIVIKALVTLSPKDSLNDWERRRKILLDNNIRVSNWYSYSDATIIEDFYPYKAIEKVSFGSLLKISKKLDEMGFNTLNFLGDLRSDSKSIPYYIDFGFDLGEPSSKKVETAKKTLIRYFPTRVEEINKYYNL